MGGKTFESYSTVVVRRNPPKSDLIGDGRLKYDDGCHSHEVLPLVLRVSLIRSEKYRRMLSIKLIFQSVMSVSPGFITVIFNLSPFPRLYFSPYTHMYVCVSVCVCLFMVSSIIGLVWKNIFMRIYIRRVWFQNAINAI